MYKAKVKWNGDHYEAGQEVRGSKYRILNGKIELYDDEENYIMGFGDFTRYTWVEIDELTLRKVRNG